MNSYLQFKSVLFIQDNFASEIENMPEISQLFLNKQ